jgi:CPA1 family monovalent cation:H+ antiporter
VKLIEAWAYAPDGTVIHPQLLETYRRRASVSQRYTGNESEYQPRLQAHFDLVLQANAAGRAALLKLHRAGQIDDRALNELERDLDFEELAALSAKVT